MEKIFTLHDKPYKEQKNNRKLTLCRLKMELNSKVQSIPIYEKGEFKGFKYIFHK